MSDQRTLATLLNVADSASDCHFFASWAFKVDAPDMAITGLSQLKWFTEFGHLNRGDMLTSEQHRCHNEKKKFQRRV